MIVKTGKPHKTSFLILLGLVCNLMYILNTKSINHNNEKM